MRFKEAGKLIGSGVLLFAIVVTSAAEEKLTAQQVLENAIAYHDPHGVWDRGVVQLTVNTAYSEEYAKRAGTKVASAELWLSPAQRAFRYTKHVRDDVVEYALDGSTASVAVNGSKNITDEDRERLRVGEPSLYRDYFEYLYGMPMKLRDPGSNLNPELKVAEFNGRESWEMRVTYDPEVGEDIWDFYFDKTTFALIGYRFFHDESKSDGEYIAFENEVQDAATGLRLPKARAWYFNVDGKHLATDEIVSMKVQALE